LLVFLLVSPSQTRRGEFRYSERRNEQMARKNDGAVGANPQQISPISTAAARPNFDMSDGPPTLFDSRTLVQHWADRNCFDPEKSMPTSSLYPGSPNVRICAIQAL